MYNSSGATEKPLKVRHRILITTAILTLSGGLGGCGSWYHEMQDPGLGVPETAIVKSLRCELITFFSINYQRALAFRSYEESGRLEEAIANFSYLPLDRHKFAGLSLDLKNVYSGSLSSSMNHRLPSLRNPTNFIANQAGGSVGVGTTYGKSQLFVIPQYANLGRALPVKAEDEPKQLYEDQGNNHQFFCYSRLTTPGTTKADRFADLQALADGDLPEFENYERIRVDGRVPLARWLQESAIRMSQNELATLPNNEGIYQGQLNYTFTLQVKPGIDLRHNLVANFINPLIGTVALAADNTRSFTIFLNARKADRAYTARTGGAELLPAEKEFVPQMP